ncbi:MAG: GAF domain-containing protein [Deltaproteobacteria bacterium]|nr:GAF domain-containing protein [Deltaproteobacteria bacterium]
MRDRNPEDIRVRELATILKFSALISSSLNIEVVLDNAMRWVEEFMDAEASTIYELDEAKNEITVRLARGEKKGPVRSLTLKMGEGVAGLVVRTRKPKIIQDVARSKRFSDKFDKITGFTTRSMICVPLLLRDKTIGAVQVLNKRQGKPFTRHDLELLTALSQQIAVAMDNAHLYQLLAERFELTVAELKKTEEKLIRSERLAGLGNLVQGVAHEIRNPVTMIGGFTRRIRKELGSGHRLGKYIDIILEETTRLENLVQKVQQLAKVQATSLGLKRVEPVVQKALQGFEPAAARQGIRIVKEIPPELPRIDMDRHQMHLALSHVIENAVESMPNGGTLRLGVRQERRRLVIQVKDTGCGIPREDLDAVYDPFFTSKTRGAGLGLTTVHQIITNHHGEIRILSEPQRGTTVELRLPVPEIEEREET